MIPPLLQIEAVVGCALSGVALCVSGATDELRLDMSQQDVERILGVPDRRAVLIGKTLKNIGAQMPEEFEHSRLIYIYDKMGLQVWFLDGRITGVTRYGVSVF
jgi:hypothetical protein